MYESIRIGHVVFASVGLASLAIPLIAKKGGGLHRKVGWVFVISMIGAALTGLMIAGAWMIVPLEVKPPREGVDPAAHAERIRLFGSFLAFVGLLLLNSLQSGIGALARKGVIPAPRPRARSLILPSAMIIGGVAMIVQGVLAAHALSGFFGVIGILAGTSDLRFMLRPLPTRMAWWYQHMSGMITASIAALTAFLVFNANRLLGDALPASLRILPWVIPTIVGLGALFVWTRYYQRKWSPSSAS